MRVVYELKQCKLITNGPEHDGNPSDGSLTVLRQVTELKFEVNKMPLQIDRIEKLLSNFMTENMLGEGDKDGDFLNNIPLGSVDAINSFDSEIKSDKRKFKKLAHLLYLLEGDTTQKIVYSHMNKLITNEAGVLYSSQGKKKKLPFMNLTLYNVILGTVRGLVLTGLLIFNRREGQDVADVVESTD
ncbi:hypothetical protein RN001_002281 [Aquatica leii]|uniref:Uncharacterized protein n=1 Tax=Aquatica leii TaxID=1421715 RepID=A0AAN7QB07_9COLE|nr:hypothetical protein RN001_002281 [Aquatica leii]